MRARTAAAVWLLSGTGALAAGAEPARLVPVATREACDTATAAVLVPGIHDTWRGLSDWVPVHAAAGRCVYGFLDDQRHADLAGNAAILQGELLGLRSRGVRRVFLTAHSMGGWIAKAALDRMTADGTIGEFESVELMALGTPWGGFHLANVLRPLHRVPTHRAARWIARLLRRPMAFEIGSRTPFVRARRARLPANVVFRIQEGGLDDVARPRTRHERENYAAVISVATERVRLEGADHDTVRRPVSADPFPELRWP